MPPDTYATDQELLDAADVFVDAMNTTQARIMLANLAYTSVQSDGLRFLLEALRVKVTEPRNPEKVTT